MNEADDYLAVNKHSWNQKTALHVDSEFYDMPSFMAGKSSLNDIELGLLGDVSGKKILHLQCHFGQDSISLSRMCAAVTGIDLSDSAIAKAKSLAAEMDSSAQFICSDVYDLPNNLEAKFDIVFTSYGTIGWLPDLDKWADVITHFLNPGGKFVFVEFHPVIWIFDDQFSAIKYRYFNSGAIEETEEGTYADRESPMVLDYVMWNHSLSEVINSLIGAGLQVDQFNEYDFSPYDCFEGTEKIADRRFRIKKLGDKLPMVYSVVASKND